MPDDDLRCLLQQYFGHQSFRAGQRDLVDAVLEGRDLLAVMPTGSGKSLGFQLPAVRLSGITLVVSPLISLMKEQVDQLQQRGIRARCAALTAVCRRSPSGMASREAG